jgi:hypothetical protein
MTSIPLGEPDRKSLPQRVLSLLRRPRLEWPLIAEEVGGIRSLYFRYVIPLVVIGPLCGYIGELLFGVKMGALVFPPDPISAGFGAAAAILLHLIGIYVTSRVIDALAPSFGGEANPARAFKVAVYSATPVWLAGVFALYPPLWVLGVVGLYSIYLVYRGLPILMRTNTPRPWLYALLISMFGLVLVALAGVIPATITRINLVPKPGEASRWEHRQFRFPGFDDSKRIQKVLKQGQAANQQLSAAEKKRPPVRGEELRTLLPNGLAGGFTRTAVQSSDQKLGPIQVAKAKAVYVAPKSRITLEVVDMGGASALTDDLKPHAESDNAHGYAKLGLVDGRLTSEQYDRDAHTGSYGVVVAGRFAVKAEGDHVVIGDLEKAVKAVDFERLEAMAKG